MSTEQYEQSITERYERQKYIDGLRALADALEVHPEIPLPANGQYRNYPLTISFGYGSNPRERLAAAARAIRCNWAKSVDDSWLNLDGQLGGLYVQLYGKRDDVCTRRVVGTEQKEVEVEIIPAVTEKVTKEVEIVEWDCTPILAPARIDGSLPDPEPGWDR